MRKLFIYSAAIALSGLIACGKTEVITIESQAVSLLEEYPMEGANTVTGVWSVDLGDVDASKIKKGKLVSVRFEMESPETTDGLEEVTVQLAASGASMQKVAVLNPVPAGQQTMAPTVADSQANLADLLKQKEITIVADINLKEDIEGELALNAVLTFEIEVKK